LLNRFMTKFFVMKSVEANEIGAAPARKP